MRLYHDRKWLVIALKLQFGAAFTNVDIGFVPGY